MERSLNSFEMTFEIGNIEVSIGRAFADPPFFNPKHYWFDKWDLTLSKGFSFGIFYFGVWVIKSKHL